MLYATETGILDPFLESHCNFSDPEFNTVWHEIYAGVYFCGLAFFFVLRELIFAIRADWFFRLGINFTIFRKYPVPSVDNILFLLSTYNRNAYYLSNNTTVCVDISLYTALFLNERDKTQLNRHDFLVLYFCVVNLS